ncbi:uncharacterized protein EDB91DRAFT_1250786 [Suillus paluster]|uniref:uncharacterized protein n=1 Tax=Suillus paluster TaxID=48578 RepID=UPI001B884836|nr:uncharacterized protein EDB91DRAFT_1250786 [Suillus paluster]KAG1734667.1 hypothetical protein EDB91DRAFT_1250786 [Suillus paluster]
MDGVINAYDLPMLYSYQALTYFYGTPPHSIMIPRLDHYVKPQWPFFGLTFDEELVYLRKSKWGTTKALFITARYSTFGVFFFRVYMDSMSDPNVNDCHTFDLTVRVFTLLSIGCSEGLYIIRAYALWRKSKRVLTLILVTYSVGCSMQIDMSKSLNSVRPASFSWLPWGYHRAGLPHFELVSKSPVSTLVGCYLTSQGNLLYVMFISLMVFELELVILVGIQVIKSYRESGSHLLKVIVQQNATYYACGLLWSAVNILAFLLLKDDYSSSLQYFQIGMHYYSRNAHARRLVED